MTAPPKFGDVIAADQCSAVSDDAIAHLAIRDQLNRTIYKAIRDYRMTNMACDDDGHYPYPLVDLMSNPAPADISTGEMEMIALADEVAEAVRTSTALPLAHTAAPQGEEVSEALRIAVKALRAYADPTGYADKDDEPYAADEQCHPGKLAELALEQIAALAPAAIASGRGEGE